MKGHYNKRHLKIPKKIWHLLEKRQVAGILTKSGEFTFEVFAYLSALLTSQSPTKDIPPL